jgi:hypothetical protein
MPTFGYGYGAISAPSRWHERMSQIVRASAVASPRLCVEATEHSRPAQRWWFVTGPSAEMKTPCRPSTRRHDRFARQLALGSASRLTAGARRVNMKKR